jgi:hypothetical protein
VRTATTHLHSDDNTNDDSTSKEHVKMTKLAGTVIRAKVVDCAELVCPRCGVDRHGDVVELERWGCLLGLPIVRLEQLDPMIECTDCGYRAGTCVLEIPTAAVLAVRLEAAMRSAVATMVRAADGPNGNDFDLTDEAVRVMDNAGYDYDPGCLADDLADTDDIETSARLRLLADDLTPHGKQGFLHRMIALALADGPISGNERRALERMGVALGMAPPHIIGVLGTASQPFQAA